MLTPCQSDPEELWKDIFGFEDFYQISSLGRVRSLDRVIFNRGSGKQNRLKGKLLKLGLDKDGYNIVSLYQGSTAGRFRVARLVLEHFVRPDPNNDYEADHRSGDRRDDRLQNLRWLDVSANRSLKHISIGVSGVVGVTLRPEKENSFQAYFKRNKRFRSLGHFQSLEQAAAARKQYEDSRG